MGSRELSNPMMIQKSIRDNSTEVQNFLSELSNWSTEMKAKELAESSCDLTPVENVPVRSDPQKRKEKGKGKEKLDEPAKDSDPNSKKVKKLSSYDYSAWEKFDADKACEEIDTPKNKKVESEEDAIRRKAIEMRLSKMANEKKDVGNQYLKEKNYSKAIECYSEGIRCDKKNAVLYANRAQAYIFMKQYDKAIEDCTECIRNDVTYVKAYFRRAKALVEAGKLNDARNDINLMLKMEPSNSEAKKLLNDINRRTLQSLLEDPDCKNIPINLNPNGPPSSTNRTGSRTSQQPVLKTMLGSKFGNINLLLDEEEDELYDSGAKGDSVDKFPRIIVPIKKPPERRSKRPLLPIHVKILNSKEKKMRLDYNGNDGNSSVSNSSSTLSTPVADPPSPTSSLTSSTTNAINGPCSSSVSLPNLFSQLKMTSIPPKPKTAATFNSDWKKLKLYPDMCAQYLKQMESDDYLIFQDSMEYSILSDILDLLVWEFIPQKWNFICHLEGLLKVRRFNTLLMFMTEKDRANARKLISECPIDIQSNLKSKYDV